MEEYLQEELDNVHENELRFELITTEESMDISQIQRPICMVR